MGNRLKSLYFMIVSFASLIGIAICGGIILYSSITFLAISSDEYLQGSYMYDGRICEEPLRFDQDEPVVRSQEAIDECIQQRTQQILTQRSLNFKKSIIGGLSRGIVFAIIFVLHFPTFRKLSNQ